MEEEITAKREAWSLEAASALSVSLAGDVKILEYQVNQGIAELWHFERSDDVDLWALVRREGFELVFCCVEGKGVVLVVPLLIEAAKKAGVKRVRAHTSRPALSRLFKDWKLKEYVYTKEI